MATITLKHVVKRFENKGKKHGANECVVAVADFNLEVADKEFVVLVGPSGCGKSTLLNAMAGFLKPTKGTITIDGNPVQHPSISYVTIFQNYGLLPWRSVERNVTLGLETKRFPRKNRKRPRRNTSKW